MSSTRSVSKVVRSSERKRLRNCAVRSGVKTRITKARKLLGEQEAEAASQTVGAAISGLDRAVSKGVIHRNKGARLKSRLTKKLNAVVAVSQSLEPSASRPSEEEKRPKRRTRAKVRQEEVKQPQSSEG